jgi:hypothetical protein
MPSTNVPHHHVALDQLNRHRRDLMLEPATLHRRLGLVLGAGRRGNRKAVDLNAPEQRPNGYRQEDKNLGALATM